jgi:hypothetical protein
MKATIERSWIEVLPDPEPDASYLYQAEPDFSDRRAEYEAGSFAFVGVRACAEVRFETDAGGWITGPTVTSAGLWSVESDSGEDYFRDVGRDESADLMEMLTALGIQPARAATAARNAVSDIRYR